MAAEVGLCPGETIDGFRKLRQCSGFTRKMIHAVVGARVTAIDHDARQRAYDAATMREPSDEAK